VSSVAPSRTLARMKACREAAELSGIATSRTRPERVSRYFALKFRGLARFVVRSTTSTAPATMILPACRGSKNSEGNLGLIDLDHPLQKRAIRIDHGAAQLLRQKPCRLVGHAKLGCKLQRRHAVGMRRHQMRRPEPYLQRQLRAMQNRPGRDRGLATAIGTFIETCPACQRPAALAATARAHKPLRPPPRREKRGATLFVRKLSLELAQ